MTLLKVTASPRGCSVGSVYWRGATDLTSRITLHVLPKMWRGVEKQNIQLNLGGPTVLYEGDTLLIDTSLGHSAEFSTWLNADATKKEAAYEKATRAALASGEGSDGATNEGKKILVAPLFGPAGLWTTKSPEPSTSTWDDPPDPQIEQLWRLVDAAKYWDERSPFPFDGSDGGGTAWPLKHDDVMRRIYLREFVHECARVLAMRRPSFRRVTELTGSPRVRSQWAPS